MPHAIQWGILGTGNIASQFAQALRLLPEAGLLAVGSRSQESADAFAGAHRVPRAYGSYEALARDPGVEVVYIATPHHLHKDNSLLCLEHGKAVLCEKPFTLDAREAALVVHTARAKGLFCMEAMWNRFVPIVRELDTLLSQGAIGDVRMLNASLGLPFAFNPQHRVFAPPMGGGALLDLGVYPVSFALRQFGKPTRITSHAVMGETGVDEQLSILLDFPEGRQATLGASLRNRLQNDAALLGTRGMLHLHEPLNCPSTLTWTPTRAIGGTDTPLQPPRTLTRPVLGNGYAHEAVEVMRCLREGLLESPLMPLEETLLIMHTMDAIQATWGRASS
jgi:predicted dehydrogenase